MHFDVLGSMRVRRDQQTTEPSGRMQCTLLGMLLAHANSPVAADLLVDALWNGDPVARSENRL